MSKEPSLQVVEGLGPVAGDVDPDLRHDEDREGVAAAAAARTPAESMKSRVPKRLFISPSAIGERTEFQVQAKRMLPGSDAHGEGGGARAGRGSAWTSVKSRRAVASSMSIAAASSCRMISAPSLWQGAPTHVDRLDLRDLRRGPDRLVVAVADGRVVAQRMAQRRKQQHGLGLRNAPDVVLDIEEEPSFLLPADAQPDRGRPGRFHRRDAVLLQQVVDGDAAFVLVDPGPGEIRRPGRARPRPPWSAPGGSPPTRSPLCRRRA